jgi:hypothetical protein
MARTENRTEIHRKFAEQIQAIESVAKETKGVATETKGVATAITGREDSMANIPELVILLSALIRALQDNCKPGDGITPVDEITFNNLSNQMSITKDQADALTIDIGFDDDKLQKLYLAICPQATEPHELT